MEAEVRGVRVWVSWEVSRRQQYDSPTLGMRSQNSQFLGCAQEVRV